MSWTKVIAERRAEETRRIKEREKLQKTCKHEGEKYSQCTDFHRRDYGTFCKECDLEL